MKNDITLNRLDYNEQGIILDIINKDSTLCQTFKGKENTISRIINSSYAATINKNNTIIGFIMLVYNQRTNSHEIDLGILEKYQNYGYGTIALGKMKDLIQRENVDISIQVKKENTPAIRIVTKNNFTLVDEDEHHNYYGVKSLRREL